jgi:hypothetical protein
VRRDLAMLLLSVGLATLPAAAAPAATDAPGLVEEALPCLRRLLEDARWGMADYEVAAWLVSEPAGGVVCVPWPRTRQSGRAEWPAGRALPPGIVAQAHTHATRAASGRKFGAMPSWQDCLTARRLGVPVWVVSPQGVTACEPQTTRMARLLERDWLELPPRRGPAGTAFAARASRGETPSDQPDEPAGASAAPRPRRRPRTRAR